MKISSIVKKGENVEILLEDGSKLKLKVELNESDNLYEGKDLSDSFIKEQSEYLKVKESAFRYLARRSHSVYELRTKLKKKDYPLNTIEQVLNEFIDKNLLDDKKFAAEFYENRIRYKSDGNNKIISGLMQRGIDRNIIDEVIRKNYDEEIHYENALKLASRKIEQIKIKSTDSMKLRARLSMYLQNKGFSFEIIKKVTQRLGV